MARIVLGSQFEWTDLLAYTLGLGLVLSIERLIGPIRLGRRRQPDALPR